MSIKIKFSDLNESEKDQIFDLLILKNMVPQIDYSKDTKEKTILKHFIKGLSLNKFEAERLGDHCLHSTISHFINDCGMSFYKKREKVKTRFGKTCVVRYWLDELGIKKAKIHLKETTL